MSNDVNAPERSAHRAATLATLERHGERTARQVAGAGGSWRALMDLERLGLVEFIPTNGPVRWRLSESTVKVTVGESELAA